MKKCRCKRSACVLWVVLIAFLVFISTANLIIKLGNLNETAVYKSSLTDSNMATWTGALLLWGGAGYMIHLFYKSAATRILFDEEQAIFILSHKDKRAFRWEEMQPEQIQIEWQKVSLNRPDFLHFVFEDSKSVYVPTNFVGYDELESLIIEHGVIERCDPKWTENRESNNVYGGLFGSHFGSEDFEGEGRTLFGIRFWKRSKKQAKEKSNGNHRN